ncbi:MAG: DUF2267 domain-containing protein [Bradymonadaceae bacterium]|nr:DUF2267 domain-containing protein [Lujinxingiaceae bacterium]
MNYEIFMQRVMRRSGIDDEAFAHKVVVATLEVLGQRLPEVNLEVVAAQLPAPFEEALWAVAAYQRFEPEQFYEQVGLRTGVQTRFALEHAQVVCQVLTEALNEQGRTHLCMHLPQQWCELFTRREHTFPPSESRRRRGQHTLAGGHSGSSRPLSESSVAQRNSIAAGDEPHADQMLATSHGKPARRTLAEGEAGSSRPMSEGFHSESG